MESAAANFSHTHVFSAHLLRRRHHASPATTLDQNKREKYIDRIIRKKRPLP